MIQTKLTTMLLGLVFTLSLYSQTDNTLQVERQIRNYDMKKFDKETFEKNKNLINEYKFKTETEKIRQLYDKDDNTYVEEIKNKEKSFETQTIYWGTTLMPKQITYTISACIVGKMRFYDPQGNQTQVIDYDQKFKYSIYQVADFVLQQDGVDMFVRDDPNKVRPGRQIYRVDTVLYPYYQVRFKNKENQECYYLIDGTTGEIIRKRVNGEYLINKPDPNEKGKNKESEPKKKKGLFGW